MLNFCPTSDEQEGSQLKFIFFTYRLQILVLLLAVFTFIGVVFVYNGNIMGFIPNANLQGTPIYNAFSSPEFIYVGLVINFSLSIPSAFDLIVDLFDPPINIFSFKYLLKFDPHPSLYLNYFHLILKFYAII